MRSLLRLLPLLLLAATALHAGRPVESPSYDLYLDNILFSEDFFPVSALWGVMAAGLVFIMHLGFATLESGLGRSKNAVNVLYKNVFVVCLGFVAYAICGYTTMFPGEFNGWFAFHGWAGFPAKESFDIMTPRFDPMPWWVHFLFQATIAAKAATIVSGAVAERQKLVPFVIFAILLTVFAYPVAGSWSWGKGWLFRQGFIDFAGTSVVHVFGGFAALACVLVLGPRKGRYVDGKVKPMPGHNLPLATIGMFVLWFGWLGFNGGSVGSAHPEFVGLAVTNTALAGAAGGLAAMLLTPLIFKKPDVTMAINGVLSGLVAVTGCADIILPHHALIAGAIGGVIVLFAVPLLDCFKIDDPIGAIPVHAIGGIWGTMVAAVFANANPWIQATGALVYAIAAFVFSFVVFWLLKITISVRATDEQQDLGLDLSEHGQEAYPTDAVSQR